MTTLFRTGYIPDPEGHLRTPWRGAAHGSGSVPTAASLELEADVALQGHFDQGDTGSCTGHALAGCIATAFRAAGKPLPFVPSPAGIYTMARAVDRYDVHEPLEDIGAMPNQAVRGVQEWGVRPMHALSKRWSDAEAATINREPQLEDIAESLKTLIVGARAIRTTGSARALDTKRALSTGLPIAAAINGGCDAFQGYSSGILTADDLRGQRDHYVWLFGYDRDTYFVWNSWGVSWGIGGNAVLAASALDLLGDLYVILPDRA